jgi:tRNA pseudouridine55 synthase
MIQSLPKLATFSESNHAVVDIINKGYTEYIWADGTVFLIDKPKGWSSFKVVHELRKVTNFKKIGHAGTLDPMATGLLVLCTGKATKKIEQIQSGFKVYEATITFGASTPSYDAETEIDGTAAFEHIDQALIEEQLEKHFSGEIKQIAPAYSALKHKGQPLYKLARAGKETPIKERLVTIYGTSILSYTAPNLTIAIHCGKGTYIRSIAHDLGKLCGSLGHLTSLRRTVVAPFSVDQAASIEELQEWKARG